MDNRPVFSGSAAIEHLNTTDFGKSENPSVVACSTEWSLGQSLAYSLDKGTTWNRYEGNPVLKRTGDEPGTVELKTNKDSPILHSGTFHELRSVWK